MSGRDLVLLVADRDIELTIRGLLSRPRALGIRCISHEIFVHPRHDPGCVHEGVAFLAAYSEEFAHALLILDHEGSGRDELAPVDLETELDHEFRKSVWTTRCRALVIEPELEAWVRNGSPHVYDVAGWGGQGERLRSWLIERNCPGLVGPALRTRGDPAPVRGAVSVQRVDGSVFQ